MKVFAIGSFAKPITDEERQQIMRKEVPDTLKLYLEGKIEQFWFREDKPGVIFLMNTESLDQAEGDNPRAAACRERLPWVRIHSSRTT
jgi:hypothetical protein